MTGVRPLARSIVWGLIAGLGIAVIVYITERVLP